VASVIERDGRFLFVEELTPSGKRVFNQPAGHLEAGESVVAGVKRETLEETGWSFEPESVVGCYLWRHPDRTISYLRIALAGSALSHDAGRTLDEGILRAVWLAPSELEDLPLRSPLVSQVVQDYLAGERYPLSVLKSLLD
jgi:ADP-ribose pyrophosphatase YjhB (NUDIX family)